MAAATQALVIGNAAYPGKLRLNSPQADATAVTRAFEELKIDVTSIIDEPYSSALTRIDAFIETVNLPTTTSSILYYSGHGIQRDDINYIVPIDFRDPSAPDTTRLISVQSIVDRMTSATATRIVLLDACRTGRDAIATMIGLGKQIEIDKSFFLDGEAVSVAGLAEMKAASNTFIAFAAGPGEVAMDGGQTTLLSPFTNALIKHLTSVDLPLSNLTARVRQEVLEETAGKQRTWDQSSLIVPFYFSPGSVFQFTGNFMALIGLVIATVVYSLVLRSPTATILEILSALALPVTSFTMLMAGAQAAYSRLRGAFENQDGDHRRQVIAYFRKGAAGGFLGSLVGGVCLSVFYFHAWPHPDETFGQLCNEVTWGTALAACLLGPFSLAGAHIWPAPKDASKLNQATRTLLGSGLGGIFAGLIAAPILTWHFGEIHNRPQMDPKILLPGAIAGASTLIFSIVNFDLERLNTRRLWISGASSLLSLISGAPLAAIVFGPLYLLGIVDAVTDYLTQNSASALALLAGGAVYGAPVGAVLGLVVGAAIVIIQIMSGRPLSS